MIFLRFFITLYLFFLCGKGFLSFPEIWKPLTCGALWSVALRLVPGPLVGWHHPSEASPHTLTRFRSRLASRARPDSPVRSPAACPASDRACLSAPCHRRRPDALHRLRTSKRRSAGSSSRPATTPHLSPSSPRRPHRWPSSVDHLPRRRRHRREPSPVSHFPPEGPQLCCYLTVLP
jgi:hypothetical protein